MIPKIKKKKTKLYILFSNATSETGKKLAELIKCDSGYKAPENQYDFILNYGSAEDCPPELAKYEVLNSSEIVKMNSHTKQAALELMRYHGVNVPKLMTPFQAILKMKLPILARKSSHKSGRDCMICITENDVRKAVQDGYSHFMDMLSIGYEGRVHIFNGIAWMVQEKYARTARSQHIRTMTYGWYLKTKNRFYSAFPRPAIHQAVLAVQAVGLLFGAVDVGISTIDGKPYVFEVNTGAGLTGGDHCQQFINVMKSYMETQWKQKI